RESAELDPRGDVVRAPREEGLERLEGRRGATPRLLPLREVLAVPSWEVNQYRQSKASVHYRLGVVLAKAGKTADARAAYEAAVRVDPKLKPAREALAELRG
ncbi:MAG: tetratricopeptide repeat protein, partial [Gemmatimonadota bacterium]